jgi:hypothetical protein
VICFSFDALPQCNEFMVFRTKGDVKLIRGTKASVTLKNMKIEESDQLRLGPESYAVMLSGSDKALRLTVTGIYSYTDLRSMCQKNQTSLTREYMNYVAQSIIEKEEPKTAMVIKGAVYRTRMQYEKSDMILPPDSSVVSSEMVNFSWHRAADNSARYLIILENGVKEIYSKLLSDTTISLQASLFKPQTIYFWLVSTNQKPSDKEARFTFVFGDKEWKTEFLDNENVMNELENEIQKTNKKIKGTKPGNSGINADTLR